MRSLGALPSLRTSRNPLAGIAIFAIVLLVAYKAAEVILSDDFTTFAYVGIMAGAAVVVVAILNNWRRGVYVLVAWVLFEDFVRKFLGNNMAIYFAKDALTLVLYLAFFHAQRTEKAKTLEIPFKLPLLVFIWFGLLQVFNPGSTSIFYGILGMKIYFLYVPLIFIGYAFIQSEEDLRRFLSFNCVLILVIAGLGLAQSIIGPTFLNPAHPQEDIRELSTIYRTAPISGLSAYRPTSVFVSNGRFQDFLIVSWLISLGYVGYLLLRSKRGRFSAFLTLGVVGAASIMSASRGVFMWNSGCALLVVGGFLWGAPWRQGQVLRTVRTLQRASLFVGIGIILLSTLFPKELGARLAIYSETLLPSSSASELTHRTSTYPLQQLGRAFDHPRWPYGYGIGTCTLGGQYVVRILHAQPLGVGVESGFGNLIVELGIVGLALWIVLGASISFYAWKTVVKLKGTPWFPISFVIFLYSVLLFFPMTFSSFNTFQDYVISAYFWMFTGILYRLLAFRNAYLAVGSAPSGRV
jgi:hypothetical protein